MSEEELWAWRRPWRHLWTGTGTILAAAAVGAVEQIDHLGVRALLSKEEGRAASKRLRPAPRLRLRLTIEQLQKVSHDLRVAILARQI